MRAARVHRPQFGSGLRVLAALLVALSTLVANAGASHFRYGTLSWEPLQTYDGAKRNVEFTFKATFRKNYRWGSHTAQWAQTNSVNSTKVYYGSEISLQLAWHSLRRCREP